MTPLPRPVEWLGRLKQQPEPSAPPRRKPPEPAWPHGQLRATWQLVSLLLCYPDDRLLELLDDVEESLLALPAAASAPLSRLVAHLRSTSPAVLRSDYVDTFDTTRKCALHLTYYAHGDTRKRGIALVQFKQAYRRAGLEVGDGELPDHLSVLLEFGATGDVAVAWRLLNNHRAGIELLQRGLESRPSAWVDAVRALQATLPELDGTQAEAVNRLITLGPPDEEVGLDAYSLDPRLNPHPDDDPMLLDHLPVQGATR